MQGDTSLDPRPSKAPKHSLTRLGAISSSCSQRIDHYGVKVLQGGRLLGHILAGVGLGAVVSVLSWHCFPVSGSPWDLRSGGTGLQDCGLLGAPAPTEGKGTALGWQQCPSHVC